MRTILKKIKLFSFILFLSLSIPVLAKPVQIPVGYDGSFLITIILGENVGTANFVIDTGATTTTVSLEAITALEKNKQAKFIREVTVTLADESKIKINLYKISQLTIGDVTLKDVEVLAPTTPNSSIFLLGMNVLERLEPFSFDLLKSGNAILTVEDGTKE